MTRHMLQAFVDKYARNYNGAELHMELFNRNLILGGFQHFFAINTSTTAGSRFYDCA